MHYMTAVSLEISDEPFLFRLTGSTLFRYVGSTQLALGGQTHAAFPSPRQMKIIEDFLGEP